MTDRPSTSPSIPAGLATPIRLVVFDVDGVLTDAGVYIGGPADGSSPPIELKRFDIQDGLGMKLLEMDDLRVVWISGRSSPATAARAAELRVECHQDGGARKFAILSAILEREQIGWGEVAMLADDLPDLSIFGEVGLAAAVANARPEVLAEADWVSAERGGFGAARDFCEALLKARGSWDRIVDRYVQARKMATLDDFDVQSEVGGAPS